MGCLLEDLIRRFNRGIFGYCAAPILSLLAVGLTYYVPIFGRMPWILSFFAVAVIALMGGAAPALLALLIASCGIYGLILAPSGHHVYDSTALIQTVAFDLSALLVVYLVRRQALAISALQISEMDYRSVTDTASDVVITMDRASRILSINPAVKAMFGYDPEELLGEEMPILMPERYRAAHLAGIARHLDTGTRHIPWTGVQLPGRHKNGDEIPLEISFGSYISQGEKRFTGFMRDVSDRVKAQAALTQSEKLAAVGRLASSIAHEINNPLESVTNLLYLATNSDDFAQVQEYLEAAERELRRVSTITTQTLRFHKQSSNPKLTSSEDLIDSVLSIYQGRLLNSHIEVKYRKRDSQQVVCFEGEIRQVLNNLVGNAIDAMHPKGGQLLLRSREATDWSSGRRGLMLTVADTGAGIGPHSLRRIFEPFFTTKGIGGSGLGLWISQDIVARHHGTLQVRSSQREGCTGTVFSLFLPLDPAVR
ncbi:MAG: two-component system sensor histidine kinase NtrB [Acidobacteriaceae bacterium]